MVRAELKKVARKSSSMLPQMMRVPRTKRHPSRMAGSPRPALVSARPPRWWSAANATDDADERNRVDRVDRAHAAGADDQAGHRRAGDGRDLERMSELRLMALVRCSSGTRLGMRDWKAGAEKAAVAAERAGEQIDASRP